MIGFVESGVNVRTSGLPVLNVFEALKRRSYGSRDDETFR
jgi:hypothetical protein